MFGLDGRLMRYSALTARGAALLAEFPMRSGHSYLHGEPLRLGGLAFDISSALGAMALSDVDEGGYR